MTNQTDSQRIEGSQTHHGWPFLVVAGIIAAALDRFAVLQPVLGRFATPSLFLVFSGLAIWRGITEPKYLGKNSVLVLDEPSIQRLNGIRPVLFIVATISALFGLYQLYAVWTAIPVATNGPFFVNNRLVEFSESPWAAVGKQRHADSYRSRIEVRESSEMESAEARRNYFNQTLDACRYVDYFDTVLTKPLDREKAKDLYFIRIGEQFEFDIENQNEKTDIVLQEVTLTVHAFSSLPPTKGSFTALPLESEIAVVELAKETKPLPWTFHPTFWLSDYAKQEVLDWSVAKPIIKPNQLDRFQVRIVSRNRGIFVYSVVVKLQNGANEFFDIAIVPTENCRAVAFLGSNGEHEALPPEADGWFDAVMKSVYEPE
jgi:hypothetical protein